MKMPSQDLLDTKLFFPAIRQDRVSRPRLIELLNHGLHRKLTLLSAPAGFGKTTLLLEWLGELRSNGGQNARGQTHIAWLSLDENDNDTARFLAYLIAALHKVDPGIAQGALSMLQSPQPPPAESILTLLINSLTALPNRIVLVLDDYHFVKAQPVHNAAAFLLDHLPPHLHLVIATREDPPLPLASLRARDQLTELRASDLRFTDDETAQFLKQVMGLNLSPDDVEALYGRTEGWIAGLQLAGLSMRGLDDPASFIASFTGGHHFILDYLISEVLQKRPEKVQDFLVKTSILDRLCGPLCDALTGRVDGQQMLQALNAHNMFIVPLDDDRRWFRYHHLFSDLLRQRLQQQFAQEIPALHRAASDWHSAQGNADQAIQHALLGEDSRRAADLIVAHFDAFYQSGEHARLRALLAQLPGELEGFNPQIYLIRAWDQFTRGRLNQAAESLSMLDQLLASETSLEGEELSRLVGRAAMIRSFVTSYGGDASATLQLTSLALENLPPEDYFWRSAALIARGDAFAMQGMVEAAHEARAAVIAANQAPQDPYLLLIGSARLAETLREQGEPLQITHLCLRQLRLAEQRGISETVAAGYLQALWGEASAELNKLDEALSRTREGMRLVERGQDRALSALSSLCLASVLFSRGDLAGAGQVIDKVVHLALDHELPQQIPALAAAWRARISLRLGDLDAAADWAYAQGLQPDVLPDYAQEAQYLVFARLLIAQRRMESALRLLTSMRPPAQRAGRLRRALEILVLEALGNEAVGEPDAAMDTLQRALAFAEPRGFVRIFADEGSPMAHMLRKAQGRGMAPEYVFRLQAAITSDEETRAGQAGLVEPLSEREIEVLRLIAEGLTNREIAARLYLSLNTVKAHTRNLYGKLGVSSRTQALARAKEVGIPLEP